MWQNETARFLTLFVIILVVLVVGIIVFFLEYRRRILLNQKEKAIMNEKHAQELFAAQIEIQQQTMQYIGREIHDNIGQKLTLAALYSQQIDHEKKYPQINERIVEVSNIINESLSELRSLSKSLTSDHIAQTSLLALIKNECDKVNAGGFCRVSFISTGDDVNASYNVKNIIARIIQEFIQNSLKHADCSAIDINIAETDKGLELTIADNGKGFIENEIAGKGIGLINIRKRAEVIGASVTIKSNTGAGTRMDLLIPSK